MRKVLAALVVSFLCFTGPALSQTVPLVAPTSKTGDEFREKARENWQRVDADYLPGEADPGELIVVPKKETQDDQPAPNWPATRIAAVVLLVLVVIGLLIAWHLNRSGGGLFRRKNSEDRFSQVVLQEAAGVDQAASNDDISLEKLSGMTDLKAGLRLLLLHGLRRATGENKIPLRRSYTSRDILALVPETWPERSTLSLLVSRVEPVFFGGRELDAGTYTTLLGETEILFAKPARRGRPT